MAGVFNPQMREARQGQAATIVPDSYLSGAADLLNSATRTFGSGDGDTQKEKDNKALRPVMKEFDKIRQLRDTGQISQTEAQARANKLKTESIQAFPMLKSTIVENGSSILGEDIDILEVDALSGRHNEVNKFFSENAEGRAQLPWIVSKATAEDGTINNELAQRYMDQYFTQYNADQAYAARIKMEAETNKNVAAIEAPKLMSKQNEAVNQQILGIVNMWQKNGKTTTDTLALMSGLEEMRIQSIATAEAQAAQYGLLGTEAYSTESINAKYDALEKMLTSIAGDPKKLAEFKQSEATLALIESLTEVGIPPTREAIEQTSINMVNTNAGAITEAQRKAISILRSSKTAVGQLGVEGSEVADVTIGGLVTDEALRMSQKMSDIDRRTMIDGGVASISEFGAKGDLNSDEQRVWVSTQYGRTVAAMEGDGRFIGPSTFDKVYNADFVRTYNKMISVDTPESAEFVNTAGAHLSKTITGARQMLDQTTQNSLRGNYAYDISVSPDGVATVTFTEGLTEKGALVYNALVAAGLPTTPEGARELLRSQKGTGREGMALTNALREINYAGIDGAGKYLTKTVAFAKQLKGLESIVPNDNRVTVDANTPPTDMKTSEEVKGGVTTLDPIVEEILFPHIEEWEGLRLTAYQDTGGVWTIGYGHTGPEVVEGMTITGEEAKRLYKEDSASAARTVTNETKGMNLTPKQIAALVSFTYNVGSSAFKRSTLLKKLKEGDLAGAAEEFKRWVYDDGKKIDGLVNRRQSEAKLFSSGIETS